MKEREKESIKDQEDRSLSIQYCPTCAQYIFYPRALCPHCWQGVPEWKESSGRGKVYTYTVVRKSYLPEFASRVPYIYALVELAEGIRLPSNIIDCPVEQIRIGMQVELAWVQGDFGFIPVFRRIEV
ncbi:MAG: hypothetical protein GX119_08595 [Syntrophomonadaceae bacterium]|jgi:uncharacterized OB-fold protein|nr:hypothetical protein [Syntrophomonadaceae bacterium]